MQKPTQSARIRRINYQNQSNQINPVFYDDDLQGYSLDPVLAADPNLSVNNYYYDGILFSQKTTVPRFGLSSYYKFEESNGAFTFTDSGPAGNILTNFNGVTRATGSVGYGVRCALSSANYMQVNSNPTLRHFARPFTWSLWVNLDNKTGDHGVLVSKWGFGDFEYQIDYHVATDRFRFYVLASGTQQKTIVANNFGSPPTGVFNHLLCWYNGSSINIRVNNGVPDTTGAYITFAGSDGTPLSIGMDTGAGDYQPNAVIDEVAYWQRELTYDEHTRVYNKGLGSTYPTGTN